MEADSLFVLVLTMEVNGLVTPVMQARAATPAMAAAAAGLDAMQRMVHCAEMGDAVVVKRWVVLSEVRAAVTTHRIYFRRRRRGGSASGKLLRDSVK